MSTLEEKFLLAQKKLIAPQILAPAGGREQFFAALNAGADAVYLGLNQFNARARATNFDLHELRELVGLAKIAKMQVLVTLNILIKQHEIKEIFELLQELSLIEIDAVIVQDLGLAKLIREFFPEIRMHASTQLAVHNLEGVLEANLLGFKRVVLARELTSQELRLIHKGLADTPVELEVFCHGSLCYSYSGLCFFSGAEDARSGNRGECAYTCRKPYQVTSEPGYGFLFSMKDLNTSSQLDKLVETGVHTLKIEGRKKDAQYVASVVNLYRKRLNEIFGYDTAPNKRSIQRDPIKDMPYSYHRASSSFFMEGRYHENVIDLDNPTHLGQEIGDISKIGSKSFWVKTSTELERFDGIKIVPPHKNFHAKPQHGEKVVGKIEDTQQTYENKHLEFSLRNFKVKSKPKTKANAGELVEVSFDRTDKLKIGDRVFKIRSNELKRETEKISQPPSDYKLKPHLLAKIFIKSTPIDNQLILNFKIVITQKTIIEKNWSLALEVAKNQSSLHSDLTKIFSVFGNIDLTTNPELSGDFEYFVPQSVLKKIKNQLADDIQKALEELNQKRRSSLNKYLTQNFSLKKEKPLLQIKIDRLKYLDTIKEVELKHFKIEEILFEPKRSLIDNKSIPEILDQLGSESIAFRFAIPTVLRAWDVKTIKPWIKQLALRGHRKFEVGNIGAFNILKNIYSSLDSLDISSDFSLYSLNTLAIDQLEQLNVSKACLSIEDDETSLLEKLNNWPSKRVLPQVILFKDTPLFIAEACSLTALHNGCPGPKICGYRSLDIENDKKEKFTVAHESCKSIVYGDRAFSISQYSKSLVEAGVFSFRADFLTRNYGVEEIVGILKAIDLQQAIDNTHSANYKRRLL